MNKKSVLSHADFKNQVHMHSRTVTVQQACAILSGSLKFLFKVLTVLFTQPLLKPTKAKTIEKAEMNVHQSVKDFRRTCKEEKNVFLAASSLM